MFTGKQMILQVYCRHYESWANSGWMTGRDCWYCTVKRLRVECQWVLCQVYRLEFAKSLLSWKRAIQHGENVSWIDRDDNSREFLQKHFPLWLISWGILGWRWCDLFLWKYHFVSLLDYLYFLSVWFIFLMKLDILDIFIICIFYICMKIKTGGFGLFYISSPVCYTAIQKNSSLKILSSFIHPHSIPDVWLPFFCWT